jgi:7-carboxy-7-deazaguanine synthase
MSKSNFLSIVNTSEKLPVVDLHTCIQGEGKYMGIPHILIRLSGCNLNCAFSDWLCDTAYASWRPEPGVYTYDDIFKIFDDNPHIKHTMITGGEPTFNSEYLINIAKIAKSYGHNVTIETNGTKYVQTVADFISMSPKLRNSIPRPGIMLPDLYVAREITEADMKRHMKDRTNYEEMKKMIKYHPDYQLKFVVSTEDQLLEIDELVNKLEVPNDKVYLMPEGVTHDQLQKRRELLANICIKLGYNYTDRLHIVIYGDKRVS